MTAGLRAVVFDLDGTLVDHVGAVAAALGRWLPELGVRASDELVDAWLAAEERHLPAWRAGDVPFAEVRRRRLRDFLPLAGRVPGGGDELDGVFAGYLAHYETSWRRFDDVDLALTAAAGAGLAVAVLTNGTVEQQNAKLDAVGLGGRVGPVVTAEGVGAAKPDPAAYLAVCAELAVEPGDVLHVGDLHDLDVVAARAVGLRAVHLDREDRGPHDEPCRITSLGELPAVLGGG